MKADACMSSTMTSYRHWDCSCDYVLRERKGRGKDNLHSLGRVKSSIIAISDFGQRGDRKATCQISGPRYPPFPLFTLFSFSLRLCFSCFPNDIWMHSTHSIYSLNDVAFLFFCFLNSLGSKFHIFTLDTSKMWEGRKDWWTLPALDLYWFRRQWPPSRVRRPWGGCWYAPLAFLSGTSQRILMNFTSSPVNW